MISLIFRLPVCCLTGMHDLYMTLLFSTSSPGTSVVMWSRHVDICWFDLGLLDTMADAISTVFMLHIKMKSIA
jgi:hypothetical protein